MALTCRSILLSTTCYCHSLSPFHESPRSLTRNTVYNEFQLSLPILFHLFPLSFFPSSLTISFVLLSPRSSPSSIHFTHSPPSCGQLCHHLSSFFWRFWLLPTIAWLCFRIIIVITALLLEASTTEFGSCHCHHFLEALHANFAHHASISFVASVEFPLVERAIFAPALLRFSTLFIRRNTPKTCDLALSACISIIAAF